MCPAARCALTPAGHAGPALHGDSALCRWADRVVRPDETGWRGRCPIQSGTSRTPSPTERDVEDTVPYGRYIAQDRRGRCPHRPAGNAQSAAGHAGPALHGDSALCGWADRVVRPYGVGCRGRRLLQSGTSRTPSPTERDGEDVVPYKEGRGVPRWVRRAGGKR